MDYSLFLFTFFLPMLLRDLRDCSSDESILKRKLLMLWKESGETIENIALSAEAFQHYDLVCHHKRSSISRIIWFSTRIVWLVQVWMALPFVFVLLFTGKWICACVLENVRGRWKALEFFLFSCMFFFLQITFFLILLCCFFLHDVIQLQKKHWSDFIFPEIMRIPASHGSLFK